MKAVRQDSIPKLLIWKATPSSIQNINQSTASEKKRTQLVQKPIKKLYETEKN